MENYSSHAGAPLVIHKCSFLKGRPMKKVSVSDYIHGGTQKDFYAESEVESCSCPLCNSDAPRQLFRERGNIGIVECENCHLIYVSPRLKNPEMIYWGDTGKFFEEARWIFLGKKSHHRDRNYTEEVMQVKKHKFPGKLLDVGCNMGFFLRKAQDAGFDAYGIDPSTALTENGKKYFHLRIENNFLEQASYPEKSFDVITLIDVFEHISQPREFLGQVRRFLKDDGIACIKVPNGNYNKLKWMIAKALNRANDADLFDSYEHVVHYSISTMKKMLSECQFQIKEVFQPMPIHPPVWHLHTGHYFQYPSPFCMDWKKILARTMFYLIGKLEKKVGLPVYFSPDLMFFVKKTHP